MKPAAVSAGKHIKSSKGSRTGAGDRSSVSIQKVLRQGFYERVDKVGETEFTYTLTWIIGAVFSVV